MGKVKLGIVVSHPIQYYAPLFRVLAEEIPLMVFYCHNPSADEVGKDGFGASFQWDVDLFSGYQYEFVENVSKTPSVSDYNGCDCPSIGKRLKENKISHVVVFGWYLRALKQTLEYCNRAGIPIACRGDSQLNPQQIWYKRLLKKLYYPFFLKKYNAYLYVGQRNKEYLQHYGVKKDKLIFSPHAVDQEFWNGERIVHDGFVFIWVAKFIEKKRPQDVIQAFKMLEYQSIKLRMVGSGPHLDECRKLAKNDDRIEFLGFNNQTELKQEYLRSDALILSSNYEETWGLVVNEAFGAEIPVVVSSACGSSADLIIEGKTGFTYSLGNIDELRSCMQSMLQLWRSDKKGNMVQDLEKMNRKYSYQANVPAFKAFISKQKNQ